MVLQKNKKIPSPHCYKMLRDHEKQTNIFVGFQFPYQY